MVKKLRWGILGTGSIARTFVSDLAFIEEGEAVAVGSRSLDAAAAFAAAYGIGAHYGSYEELVRDRDVDAVYVATPHPFHRENAILALEHGKHVLVEKPFTLNAAEARDVVAAARQHDLFALEAMWTRFLPSMIAVRERLAGGDLGEIVGVQADHGQWFEKDRESRLFAPELGGGALLDLGIYPVSFASMVLGTPERMVVLADPAFTGVDATTSMLFGYASGAHAVLTCTLRARSATRACIAGEDARIELDPDFYSASGFSLIGRNGTRERFEFAREGRGLFYEAQEVARCVDADLRESPVMPLDETISIMETMDAVRDSMVSPIRDGRA
ncbi:MAG: Gfo/Idh/MocA family oxidoreductase [Acidimicrobiales bacterium]